MLTLDRALAAPGSSESGDPARIIAWLRGILAGRLTALSWEELLRRCGSPRVSNVALLGAAIGKGFLPFSAEEAAAALKTRIPPAYLEMNIRALDSGLAATLETNLS
jgi:Pyruvate/2-oxoacid:ferredoxin oxidoreductase gamma subunit